MFARSVALMRALDRVLLHKCDASRITHVWWWLLFSRVLIGVHR